VAEGERTEKATPKRREEAREKGDVATSREIPTALVLLAVLLTAFSGIGVALVRAVGEQAHDAWSGVEIHPRTMGDFHALLLHHGRRTGLVVLPVMVVILLSGVAAYLGQTGPMWAGKALGFKPSRIDVFQGMKRLVDKNKLFDLAKAFLKIGLLAMVAWLTLRSELGGLYRLVDVTVWSALGVAADLSRRFAIAAIVLLALVAIVDLFWVRYRHEEKLKMTKQEVRDERKQREGDPQLKGRIRQLQRELTRQRMIRDVAAADVVVTNPTHFAVALRYAQGEMSAPRVLAKGRGHVALRIREEARRHGVPLVENKPLAQVLYRTVEVGREIPENLYQAVAEVLAYVYRLRPRPAGGGV
jgi:flagellar biosynthetic protein FlhB